MFKGASDILNLIVKKKFKVAIISYYYPFQQPSISGVGTHVYNLVTNLSKQGCEVHVFTYSQKDSVKKIRVGEGKIILHFLSSNFKFDISNPIIEKRVRYSIFENKVLNEFLYEHSRSPFKIIHTHGWLTTSAFMLKHLHKIPWIHTVHALEKNRLNSMTDEERKLFRLTSWIEDTLIDADKLICVSESIRKEVIKSFKGCSKKTIVIPNGVDLRFFRPEQAKSKTFLTVSRFSKEKGVHMLPEIIDEVLSKTKNSKFILVLPETSIPSLFEIQKKLMSLREKYQKRFLWISKPISVHELIKYYQESSIYIQPSLYESFGLCIIEAMACGNAVIATKVGGIPETVGNSAILVKPNSRIISKQIIGLIKNPQKLKMFKRRALDRVKIFDWPMIGKKITDLYKDVYKKMSDKD